jgi:hypothetical protein
MRKLATAASSGLADCAHNEYQPAARDQRTVNALERHAGCFCRDERAWKPCECICPRLVKSLDGLGSKFNPSALVAVGNVAAGQR